MVKLSPSVNLSAAKKHVLLVVEDPWVRFRAQREFETAGCDVVSRARLVLGELSTIAACDVVLVDAALLPERSRLEALNALRVRSPRPRLVLLVGPSDVDVREQARKSGFDRVLERPTRTDALPELVRQVLGKVSPGLASLPAPIYFEVLVQGSSGSGRRHAGTAAISPLLHGGMLAVVLLALLLYTETIDDRELASDWLVAPSPPPPPPPPPPVKIIRRRVRPQLQTLE